MIATLAADFLEGGVLAFEAAIEHEDGTEELVELSLIPTEAGEHNGA